jgi:hypothetical protein
MSDVLNDQLNESINIHSAESKPLLQLACIWLCVSEVIVDGNTNKGGEANL